MFTIVVVMMLHLSGCKKGEDDPAFSLRSRKDRFSGDWSLTRGFISLTNSTTVITTKFTATRFTTTSSLNPGQEISGSYSRNLSVNKDGTFIDEVSKNNEYYKDQGLWLFLAGNELEDLKNKEAVLFKIASQFKSIGNILNQFEGEERPLFTIKLKKLTNNEMVWITNGIFDEQITEGELTWTSR